MRTRSRSNASFNAATTTPASRVSRPPRPLAGTLGSAGAPVLRPTNPARPLTTSTTRIHCSKPITSAYGHRGKARKPGRRLAIRAGATCRNVLSFVRWWIFHAGDAELPAIDGRVDPLPARGSAAARLQTLAAVVRELARRALPLAVRQQLGPRDHRPAFSQGVHALRARRRP